MNNFGFISKKKVAKEIAEVYHNHLNANASDSDACSALSCLFDSGACSALNCLCTRLNIKPMHRNRLGDGTGEMLEDMRGKA